MTTKSQCISTQIDQHLSQWIYTQFEGGLQIQSPPVEFDPSNSTGQIGGKSIEIMTTKSQCISTQIDQHLSQWIYTQFEGGSNSIPLVEFDWLNWG